MADIIDTTGYVRRLWAWDYDTPWGDHVKGFFVLIEPLWEPDNASLWLVDNPRLEAVLVAAYAGVEMVSVTSHKQTMSLSPLDLAAKAKPEMKGFPIIDTVVVPPHPDAPR